MSDQPGRRVRSASTNSSLGDGSRFPPWLVAVFIFLLLVLIASGVFIYYKYSNPTQQSKPPSIAIAALRQMTPAALYKSVTGEMPSLVDALDGRDSGAWDLYQQAGGGCLFQNKSLYAIVPPQTVSTACYLRNEFLTNFAFQVQMTMGPTGALEQQRVGGIVFDAHLIQQEGYTFVINSSSIGGFVDTRAELAINIPNKNPPILFSQQDALLNDLTSPKVLTVIVVQNKISAYINGKPFPTANDATFQGGQIGVIATSDPDVTFDTLFQNARLWIL